MVTEIDHSRTVIRVRGPEARTLLNRGLPIDLENSAFPEHVFVQSVIHHVPVLVHRLPSQTDPVFELHVRERGHLLGSGRPGRRTARRPGRGDGGAMARESEMLAGRAAAWASALRLVDVPASVVDTARACILDLAGVSLAGARDPLCARLAAYATANHAPGAAALLGRPERRVRSARHWSMAPRPMSTPMDTSYTGIMHGSAVVFPAALAAVQNAGGDGRRLLEAFIAGSEISYAIALLAGTGHYFRGWWSTATFGIFGAAAAAARGLGLDEGRTRMALAIAGAQASGLKAAFGTDAKPYMAGRAAAAGVEAALLAAAGVTGPADVLENSRGFCRLMANRAMRRRSTGSAPSGDW